jgi:catechol 2,3-dioxygenase-like lactoylglutathione lyase family enzyme
MSNHTPPLHLKQLAHLCLKTDKLNEMVAFYRDVLGFPIKFDLKNDAGISFGYYFDLGNRTFLEIFDHQLAAKQWNHPANPLERSKAMHYGHFCLESTDLEKLKAELLTRGLKTSDIMKGMDGSLQMWTGDPDGNAIELMQYTPDSLQTK